MTDTDREPTFFDDVKAFHAIFHLPIGSKPEITGIKDQQLRLRLIKEEFFELIDAHLERDIVAIADAIADLIYVACGMAVSYGIPLNEVWAAVQKSNMDKVCKNCHQPHYREDGKVAKPKGWQPPNIEGVINEYR
jgi:predicted HAD superfamily Cof-like phosphohydrolase